MSPGNLRPLINQQIALAAMAAMAGDNFREIQRRSELDRVVAETSSNDVEARLLIATVEKLEELIRGGMEFVQALDWMRNAGWADRITHHTTLRIGA